MDDGWIPASPPSELELSVPGCARLAWMRRESDEASYRTAPCMGRRAVLTTRLIRLDPQEVRIAGAIGATAGVVGLLSQAWVFVGFAGFALLNVGVRLLWARGRGRQLVFDSNEVRVFDGRHEKRRQLRSVGIDEPGGLTLVEEPRGKTVTYSVLFDLTGGSPVELARGLPRGEALDLRALVVGLLDYFRR